MWTTAIAKDTGEEYRFDGHHASYALSRLTEEEFPANWKVALRVFEIDSLAEDAVELLLRQPGGRKVAERHQAEGDRRRSGARSSGLVRCQVCNEYRGTIDFDDQSGGLSLSV